MLILMMMMAANRKQQQQKQQQQPTIQQQQQASHQNQLMRGDSSSSAVATTTMAATMAAGFGATLGKSSNSSNETVIARMDESPLVSALSSPADGTSEASAAAATSHPANHEPMMVTSETAVVATTTTSDELLADGSGGAGAGDGISSSRSAKRTAGARQPRIKSFLLLTAHQLNPFNHLANHAKRKGSMDERCLGVQSSLEKQQQQAKAKEQRHQRSGGHLNLFAFAQRYLCRHSSDLQQHQQHAGIGGDSTKSAPVTPVKWQPLEGSALPAEIKANGYGGRPAATVLNSRGCPAAGKQQQQEPPNGAITVGDFLASEDSKAAATGAAEKPSPGAGGGGSGRPSVRFVESAGDNEANSSSLRQAAPPAAAKRKVASTRWGRQPAAARHQFEAATQTGAASSAEESNTSDGASEGTVVERRHRRQVGNEEGDGGAADDNADEDAGEEGDGNAMDLVAQLFKLTTMQPQEAPASGATATTLPLEQQPGECPMDSKRFRQYGYALIDYISNYLDTIDKRRVTPLNIEPGYLKGLIQPDAPEKGESFARIMHDFEAKIMCGITHWQHPHFHAYFPAGNAYASILADMLSDALGCVGFSWAASPAYTELEIIMLDWMGKMIGLPDEFLCLSGARGGQESKGGGVIQGSASECVLVNLLAARHWAMEKLRKRHPNTPDGVLLSKLIGYCSKEAHSCVEKAAMIGFIRMRALDTDEKHSLRGDTLARAVQMDMAQGLEPFLVCATLGTTSCVSFDNLEELGQVCKEHDIWLHVDAAYAGSALICPEFKYLIKGIELVTSFNMNPNKWMLINFDCSLMWVKDRFKLTRAFVVDPLYLQHSFSDQAIDYRHWGIPLSRRFRALKLWFVIRNYGVEGLRAYIRNHVRLAKLFEQCIRQDARFMITNEVVLGLVCFRLVGSNALNQRLLSMINASGKLHMVPASVNGRYVIRFCVCDKSAQEADIRYAYRCISEFATELFESIRAGKERIRAISQQNTIDVSSLSLHTQQSASADRLNNMMINGSQEGSRAAAAGGPQQVGVATTPTPQPPVSPRQAARQYLMRRNSRHVHGSNPTTTTGSTSDGSAAGAAAQSIGDNNQITAPSTPLSARGLSPGTKSPLTKQASLVGGGEQSSAAGVAAADEEDLEQEIVLDSLATIDGYDYDLDDLDDDLLEPPFFDEPENEKQNPLGDNTQQEGAREPTTANSSSNDTAAGTNEKAMEWRSPVARRWHSRTGQPYRNQTVTNASGGAGGEQEEAEDEVFTLAERRNRMSLRYKREFFVRVVSDPRVYRASISGDINAHASCCSLGGSQQQPPPASNQTSVPASQTSAGDDQSAGKSSGSGAAAEEPAQPEGAQSGRAAAAVMTAGSSGREDGQ